MAVEGQRAVREGEEADLPKRTRRLVCMLKRSRKTMITGLEIKLSVVYSRKRLRNTVKGRQEEGEETYHDGRCCGMLSVFLTSLLLLIVVYDDIPQGKLLTAVEYCPTGRQASAEVSVRFRLKVAFVL